MVKDLCIILLMCFSTSACATAETKKIENPIKIQPWPTDDVIFEGHFGCLDPDTADAHVTRSIAKNCAQYKRVGRINPKSARVYRCQDPKLIDVTISYKCLKPKKKHRKKK